MIKNFGFKITKISEYEIIKMLLMSKSGNYRAREFMFVGKKSGQGQGQEKQDMVENKDKGRYVVL